MLNTDEMRCLDFFTNALPFNRVVRQKILCETYTAEMMPLLRSLHAEMTERCSTARTQVASLNHRLSSYKCLGSRYESLLQEYANLQKDLQFCGVIDAGVEGV